MTVFGESHGPAVGVVLDGLTPGLKVDKDFIARQLSLRRPSGRTDTARVEMMPSLSLAESIRAIRQALL